MQKKLSKVEFAYCFLEGHLPLTILQQYQNKFMPATILKTNAIISIFEQLFFRRCKYVWVLWNYFGCTEFVFCVKLEKMKIEQDEKFVQS